MDAIDFLVRIGVGAGLAAVLGLEREVSGKAAGLRTHAMVGLGSAVFTALSMEAFGSGDPARVAAQIVTGIGFVGAGAIFRSGPLVQGLTTAAGLWAAAALGMAAGAGRVGWAAIATGVAVVVLLVLRIADRLISLIRTGVRVEAVVSPAAEFLDVRQQIIALEPEATLASLEVTDDTATVQFVVGRDRADLVRAGLETIDQVERARVLD